MKNDSKIWMDGKLVNFQDAQVHVLTHALHYGSGVFEGIRIYKTENGKAIFRLREHMVRFMNSAKVIALKPDATLTRARDIMAEYSIRHLPVIHRGKLEGMVSSRDLMAVELQSAQEIIKEQRGALQAAEKQYPGITKLTTMGGRVLI